MVMVRVIKDFRRCMKKKIKIDIYNDYITLCIAPTLKETLKLDKHLESIKEEDGIENFSGLYVDGLQFILLEEGVDVGVVAHECFHATYDILKGRGIEINDSTEEAYAYLLGFLTKQVNKELEKYKNGKFK